MPPLCPRILPLTIQALWAPRAALWGLDHDATGSRVSGAGLPWFGSCLEPAPCFPPGGVQWLAEQPTQLLAQGTRGPELQGRRAGADGCGTVQRPRLGCSGADTVLGTLLWFSNGLVSMLRPSGGRLFSGRMARFGLQHKGDGPLPFGERTVPRPGARPRHAEAGCATGVSGERGPSYACPISATTPDERGAACTAILSPISQPGISRRVRVPSRSPPGGAREHPADLGRSQTP